MIHPNPNPLTKDKLKPGVIFGRWLFTKNKTIGKYMLNNNKIEDSTTEEYMIIDSVTAEFINVFNVFCGATVEASISMGALCIIQEAPESEVKRG